MRMAYSATLLLPLLLLVNIHAQDFNTLQILENIGVDHHFVVDAVKSLLTHEGSVINDGEVTTVTAKIGGKTYTATFSEGNSIDVASSAEITDGKSTEVFTITINDETYTYKTVDGRTTVTNSNGETLTDGGPFHVTSR